jgi:hypothetical protein
VAEACQLAFANGSEPGESLQHQSGKINLMEPVDTLRYSADVGQKLGKYIAANKPVVVTGLRDFPPLKWTVESLEERYGDTMIRVVVSDSQEFKYDEKKERTIVRMTLSEFIDRGIRNLGADGKYYALGRGLSTQFEGLTDEIVLPDQIARHYQGIGRFLERNLWMSHGGTRTALHFDTVDNFNIQVVGEKRFWLYPTKLEGMYPMKLNSQASYLSPVDPRKVDREKYPKFPQNGAFEVVTRPGDLLYLPYGWWHQVDTTGEENINVNFWWVPRLKLVRFWPQTMRGAFVIANRRGKHPHKRAEEQSPRTSR